MCFNGNLLARTEGQDNGNIEILPTNQIHLYVAVLLGYLSVINLNSVSLQTIPILYVWFNILRAKLKLLGHYWWKILKMALWLILKASKWLFL